jgi:subtilisin family serine protease
MAIHEQPHFRDLRYLPGYSARLTDQQVHDIIRSDPGVDLVTHDYHVQLPELGPAIPMERLDKPTRKQKRLYSQQVEATDAYNLLMISAPGKVDLTNTKDSTYTFLSQAGLGVRVYVLDSGINVNHELFGGRAVHFNNAGKDTLGTSPYTNPPNEPVGEDLRGHGTQMAGIVGASQYGVAPFSTLVNVRISGSKGSTVAGVSQAISDVANEHSAFKSGNGRPAGWRGSVINVSFATHNPTGALVQALEHAKSAGIPIIASSGNWGKNAGGVSPCAESSTICVGATKRNYAPWELSNYGSAVFVIPRIQNRLAQLADVCA